jgi:hypothetical protein
MSEIMEIINEIRGQEKLRVSQLHKNSPPFMYREGSLKCA